jgi:hypothetical protein
MQFKDEQEIVFSTDEAKKVTLVTGGQATGKTTIVEAFRFIFYGKSEKYHWQMFNHEMIEKLKVGDTYEVNASTEIVYKGIEYLILRKQVYSKNETNVHIIAPDYVEVCYRDESGVSTTITSNDANRMICEIIQQNMFKYLFVGEQEFDEIVSEAIENCEVIRERDLSMCDMYLIIIKMLISGCIENIKCVNSYKSYPCILDDIFKKLNTINIKKALDYIIQADRQIIITSNDGDAEYIDENIKSFIGKNI